MIIGLAKYKHQWFRIEDHKGAGKFTQRILQFFDMYVEFNINNQYTVVKNRTGVHGNSGPLDLLQMQLFTQKKSFYDLPLFVNRAECRRFTEEHNDNVVIL